MTVKTAGPWLTWRMMTLWLFIDSSTRIICYTTRVVWALKDGAEPFWASQLSVYNQLWHQIIQCARWALNVNGKLFLHIELPLLIAKLRGNPPHHYHLITWPFLKRAYWHLLEWKYPKPFFFSEDSNLISDLVFFFLNLTPVCCCSSEVTRDVLSSSPRWMGFASGYSSMTT